MDEAKKNLVRSWLTKARHDLGSAQLLANEANPYLDTAIYHCQQAAEKVLKAFLVYHDTDFEKKHNLSVLVDLCAAIESIFKISKRQQRFLHPTQPCFVTRGSFLKRNPISNRSKQL
jgi:HEPN domain-containing protein